MKKLKICNIGWANSIHVERLMRWLVEKGHDVSIITNRPKEIKGVKVYEIRRKSDNLPRFERYKEFHFNVSWKWLSEINGAIRIRKLVEEISPDIIHSYTLWYPGYLGVYVKGYPFIVTVLNGDVLWKKNNVDIFTKIRTRVALKKADLIVGESNELLDACLKHGVRKDKLCLMRRGVDFTKFNYCRDKTTIRHKLGLPEKSQIVLSPRNTGWFYNLDKILMAIPKVIEKIQDVIFIFIWHGDNWVREKELEGLASKLGILHVVKFIGYVDYENVALYHKASDIMVSISRYDSGPQALLEAMACGDVPVISNLLCVREWIKDGENGFLVDPGDVNQTANAIIKLLKRDKMRIEFSERNWNLIKEKGDQEFWMKKMEDMYFQVLDK